MVRASPQAGSDRLQLPVPGQRKARARYHLHRTGEPSGLPCPTLSLSTIRLVKVRPASPAHPLVNRGFVRGTGSRVTFVASSVQETVRRHVLVGVPLPALP